MRFATFASSQVTRAPNVRFKDSMSQYRLDTTLGTDGEITLFFDDEWFDAFVQAVIAARASRLATVRP